MPHAPHTPPRARPCTLTDPDFVKRLETLYLLARKVLGGTLKADRRTRKKGAGILFSDYTEYNYGDDYRSIDWKIYGRLEELVVKLFEVEEDVRVLLLLDLSRSMTAKLDYAKQLAAALGYIALNSLDRLAVYGVADRLEPVFELCHGRGKSIPFLRALDAAACYGGDTRLGDCLRALYARHKRRCLCVLISDFFTPHGYAEALNYLLWARHDVYCLQVLDPAELECDWKGDVRIECVETGQSRAITVGPVEKARYVRAVREYNETLARECAKRSIGFARATTAVPFETVIRTILRRGGLIA